MKFFGLQLHYFIPLPSTYDLVLSITPLFSYLLPTLVKTCSLIILSGE